MRIVFVCPPCILGCECSLPLITSFDPWRSGLCTCPSKLTFNPYTGCDHQCTYCYASSYILNFNSSDPYPRAEATEGLTRRCLEILAENNCRIQIITKSNIVTRDDDLLAKVPATVALTITTDDDNLAKILEPYAPSPSQRLRAAQDLTKAGIPVSVRIDPIIPSVNDQPQKLIATLAGIGVKHVTCSTYKAKADNWMRLSQALPKVMEQLKPLYFQEGERIGGSALLPRDYRFKILKAVRDVALAHGLQFGVCREGLAQLNTAACDGSWLMPKAKGGLC
jgi:DNA repair photolyase